MKPRDRALIKRREDRFGWLMIGVVAALAVTGGVTMFLLQPPPVDQLTGCVKDMAVVRRRVLVVDTSDRKPEVEAALLRSAIAAEVRGVSVGDRVTLIEFDGAADSSGSWVFDRCRSPAAKDQFALVRSAFADRDFAASFGSPSAQAIESLEGKEAKTTHLVGYLANLAARLRYEGGAEATAIVVWSDMAENTAEGTLLKGKGKRKPMSPEAFADYAARVAGERLQGVTIDVRAMVPPGGVPASERIKAAWVAAMQRVGARMEWRGL